MRGRPTGSQQVDSGVCDEACTAAMYGGYVRLCTAVGHALSRTRSSGGLRGCGSSRSSSNGSVTAARASGAAQRVGLGPASRARFGLGPGLLEGCWSACRLLRLVRYLTTKCMDVASGLEVAGAQRRAAMG